MAEIEKAMGVRSPLQFPRTSECNGFSFLHPESPEEEPGQKRACLRERARRTLGGTPQGLLTLLGSLPGPNPGRVIKWGRRDPRTPP